MKTLMIKMINAATGEEIDREMTDDELDQLKSDQAKAKADQLKSEAEAQAKAAQRQGILDRLGLTSEEAALLLS